LHLRFFPCLKLAAVFLHLQDQGVFHSGLDQ
jgi:hypothetical protein